MNLLKSAGTYFDAFKRKDINTLNKMFDENIILRDWEISVKGNKEVIEQNKVILKNLNDFELHILEMKQCELTVYAEIEIKIKDSESVKVLDKITFNKKSKIVEIIAFKG